MKKLFLISLILSSLTGLSQTARILGDSVKLYQSGGGSAELILENSTRTLTGGYLKNRLNGRTQFNYVLDSVWQAGSLLQFRYGPSTVSFNIVPPGSKVDSLTTESGVDSIFYWKNGSKIGVYYKSGGFFNDETAPVASSGYYKNFRNGTFLFDSVAGWQINSYNATRKSQWITGPTQIYFNVMNAAEDTSTAFEMQYNKIKLTRAPSVQVIDTTNNRLQVRNIINGELMDFPWENLPSDIGGSGIDSSAYHSISALDATTVLFNKLIGAPDTLALAGLLAVYVDTIYKDGDSLKYTKNGNSYGIYIGAGGGGDHGTLTGLGDDDHTQYALLAGRAAGQTLTGGTAAGDDLVLQSTSNGTKGNIQLGSSIYDEANNRLGLKGTPGYALDIWDGAYGSIVAGADLNAATRTNSTNKNGGIASPHYTNSEEPFTVARWSSSSASNSILIGSGVNPGYNSATDISIYTAANNTTLAGNRRVLWNGNTKVQFNDSQLNYDFQVSGDTDADLLWADASVDRIGIGTASPTAKLDVNSDIFRLRTAKTPASATAAGNAGDICWDANYVYVCVATNTWVRTALTTW